MIFSDEAAFDVAPPRSQYVRRSRGERIQMGHTAQHRPFLQRVMVWSCFSAQGTGQLVVVKGTMNGAKYRELMEKHLLPQRAVWFPGGGDTFQQDNAPCHRAATGFLREQGVAVMNWPAYSPDLSPIENLWAIVKRKLHANIISSKDDLTTHLQALWVNDPEIQASCGALIEGMPRRIKACIAAKGGATKY